MWLLFARLVRIVGGALASHAVQSGKFEHSEGGRNMSTLVRSLKHARYALGSLTAVLFVAGAGAAL
jgi:hypothetical protein